jgi:hypothetical protein
MPAGSGPSAVRPSSPPSITAAEQVVATLTGSWAQPPGLAGIAGNVVSVNLNVTPGAAQTLITVRVRQGAATITGTVVGIAHPAVTVAAQQVDLSFDEFDSTAYAQGPAAAQSYSVTVQGNAAGPGTINQAVCYLGTTAPVA